MHAAYQCFTELVGSWNPPYPTLIDVQMVVRTLGFRTDVKMSFANGSRSSKASWIDGRDGNGKLHILVTKR
jgi:hypothetical protein